VDYPGPCAAASRKASSEANLRASLLLTKQRHAALAERGYR